MGSALDSHVVAVTVFAIGAATEASSGCAHSAPLSTLPRTEIMAHHGAGASNGPTEGSTSASNVRGPFGVVESHPADGMHDLRQPGGLQQSRRGEP